MAQQNTKVDSVWMKRKVSSAVVTQANQPSWSVRVVKANSLNASLARLRKMKSCPRKESDLLRTKLRDSRAGSIKEPFGRRPQLPSKNIGLMLNRPDQNRPR